MVKFDTCENITVDMVISAQELLQEDMATFDGHIVEALMKCQKLTPCIRRAVNCAERNKKGTLKRPGKNRLWKKGMWLLPPATACQDNSPCFYNLEEIDR